MKHESQNSRILRALEAGNALTALDALRQFGALRLAARCAELRAQGYRIVSSLVLLPNGKRCARYRLASVAGRNQSVNGLGVSAGNEK